MIRRTLLLLIALSFIASSVLADCTQQTIWSGDFRSTYSDLAISGNDLWTATGYGVELFDLSTDPPAPVTSISLPLPTTRVEAIPGIAWAGSETKVYAIRKDPLRVTGSVDVGGIVSDLVYIAPYLYVATSNGIVQLDVLAPDSPVVANRLTTSAGPALSIDRLNSYLYVADGDSSVDVYTIDVPSFPQRVGSFSAFPRTTAVHVSGPYIYVSDGQQTSIFAGTGALVNSVATNLPFGSTSLFPIGSNAIFVAGNDRTIRALDISDPTAPVTLYVSSFTPSGGSVNRVQAITGQPGRVLVAAGDRGIVDLDTTRFTTPFPVRSYAVGQTSTIVSSGSSLYVSLASGGIAKYSKSAGGGISLLTTWDTGRTSTVQDATGNRVLASTGISLTLWDTAGNPGVVSHANFAGAVVSAILRTSDAIAVLADGTVWRIDVTQGAPVPSKLNVSTTAAFVERSGQSVAVVDIGQDGNSTIHFSPSGDLASFPVTLAIPGAATSGLAISTDGTHAAALTYRGLLKITLTGTPSYSIIPGTDSEPAQDLRFSSNRLLVAYANRLDVRDASTFALVTSFAVPNGVQKIAIDPSSDTSAYVATSAGIASIQFAGSAAQPAQSVYDPGNRFYRSIAPDSDRFSLVETATVDQFLVNGLGFPWLVSRVHPPNGIVGAAVASGQLFVLGGNGEIEGFDAAGNVVATYRLEDAIYLSLRSVGGALWASIVRGCTAGNCEHVILVFDPRSTLTQTAALTGQLIDSAVSGNRAYALVDFPGEIRSYDITDAYHPALTASRVSEGGSVSIAYSPSVSAVYALGEKLYAYNATLTAKVGEMLQSYTPDPRINYVEQKVRVYNDSCAAIIGRDAKPVLYSITGATAWSPIATPAVPGIPRSVAVIGSRIYVVTETSLEVWAPSQPRERKRPVR